MATDVDFANILVWAQAAGAAYDSDAEIRMAYGPTTWTTTLSNGVKVFIADDPGMRFQWLSVRGTDDFTNVRQDADYLESPDPRLGVHLHRGFYGDANAVYADTKARLNRALPVRVTGHSLGGAVAAILQAWLLHDGFQVETTITFGQPKVTNEEGVLKLRATPLLRVVNSEDIVPMVPPLTLLSAVRGPYRHFGQELHLGNPPPQYKLYAERDAETPGLSDFWYNLGRETPKDHHIALYVSRLQAFSDDLLKAARAVRAAPAPAGAPPKSVPPPAS